MTVAMKSELIRQEHRLVPICLNVLRYYHIEADDPRRAAALEASIWRLLSSPTVTATTVGLLGIAATIATIVLALQSNLLVAQQTQLIRRQAEQAEIQNALAEAQRMATLSQQIESIASRIQNHKSDTLTSHAVQEGNRPVYPVSLEGSIIGLSRTLQPYRILSWSGDEPRLSSTVLSPERGQLLLVALAGLYRKPPPSADHGPPWPQDDSSFFLSRGDFSYSDLADTTLESAYLAQLNLAHANLSGTTWRGCILDEADLEGANMERVDWRITFEELDPDNLSRQLEYREFGGVSLKSVRAPHARLANAQLSGVSADGSDFRGADFEGAVLNGASLRDTNLDLAVLRNAYLGRTDFRGALLPGPEHWSGAHFTQSLIEGAFVQQSDWLERVVKTTHGLRPESYAQEPTDGPFWRDPSDRRPLWLVVRK
jgi:uncharacterized protein YjbI with pentapeptide repeats